MTHRSAPRALVFAVLGGLTAAACASSGDPSATTLAPPPTITTTSIPAPVLPLTGEPLTDPALAGRPALAVKIDNNDLARPQAGLNQADLVYEEIVEVGTRLVAIFQSEPAAPIGPLRSARSSDINLIIDLNLPLFAWGGSNSGVQIAINAAHIASFNVDSAAVTAKFRDPERRAPHNLMIDSTDAFWEQAPADSGPVPQLYQYRQATESLPATAMPVQGYSVDFRGGENIAEFLWDPGRNGWIRFQNGTPHVDADDVLVAPQNVIVLFLSYVGAGADPRSPEAQTVGEGDAAYLTDGQLIVGRWKRDNPFFTFELTDQEGTPVKFTPGQTWIALPEAGGGAVIDPARYDELFAFLVPPE